MGAAISWVDESHGVERVDKSGESIEVGKFSFIKPPDIETVNISGGTFTTVAGDSITYNYHVTQTVTASDVSRLVTILSWISVINYQALHQDIHEKWTPGTSLWLIRSLLFIQWLERVCGTLWGTGMPGAGKTILASAIINYLIDYFKGTGVCVAFAYCRYTEPVSVTEILAALVRQLLEQCPSLLQFVQPLYEQHLLHGTKLTQRELLHLLRQFSQVVKIIYIIDGLDEAAYDTQFDLVEAIASLNARFLITSRPLDRLKSTVPDAVFFNVVAHAEDIELLVTQKIQRDPRFATFLEKHQLKSEVITQVTQKSGGMFLHAALQVEMLRHSLTVKDLQNRMKKLPAKIGDMYAVTLGRVNAQEASHADLAKRILIWVIYAKRTLSVRELQYAVATCPETHQFEEDRLVDEETLLSVCCGLIAVENESQRVRLVHYTAMDSLPSLLAPDFPNPHALIAEACIARLVGCGLHDFPSTAVDDLHMALTQTPLLRYAYTHWAAHVKSCQHLPTIIASTLKFLARCQTYPLDNSSELDSFRQDSRWDLEHLNPIHVAARYGLDILLKHLLTDHPQFKDPTVLNSKTNTGQTALMLASWFGHVGTVQMLVDLEDIDVNAVDGGESTALMQALRQSHEDVVKVFLTCKTLDINMNEGATLRSTLSGGPSVRLAHLLLDLSGIKIAEDIILYALRQPWWEMSQRITEYFFDKAGTGEQYPPAVIDQALTNSVYVGMSETYQNKFASYEYGIVLTGLFSPGHDFYHPSVPEQYETTVLRLLDLLKTDDPLSGRDGCGRTVLMTCAWAGIASAIPRILKQPGVDVNAVEEDGYTALALAAKQGHDSAVRILAEVPGRDVNTRNYRGWTPLIVAARRGYVDVVRTLLAQSDIEVNVVGVEQWTAIMMAAEKGYGGVVKAFSEYAGLVDVNCRGEDGETALMLAASEGHEEVMIHLLGFEGIEVNAAAKDGTTALMLAAYMGHEAVVRLLLAVPGIDVDAIGSHGVTAFSVAQEGRHGQISRLLNHC